MKNRLDSCNMITIGLMWLVTCSLNSLSGVGEVWNGEKVVQKMYPQCTLLGVDPGASVNKELVESLPNSRFVHAAVGDISTNLTIYTKGNLLRMVRNWPI